MPDCFGRSSQKKDKPKNRPSVFGCKNIGFKSAERIVGYFFDKILDFEQFQSQNRFSAGRGTGGRPRKPAGNFFAEKSGSRRKPPRPVKDLRRILKVQKAEPLVLFRRRLGVFLCKT